MAKTDFEIGSSKRESFYWWMRERHSIYQKKQKGEPKPWTTDTVLQRNKFTNVFRQLDRGTVTLHRFMLTDHYLDPPGCAWNIIWYRLFNWYEHALDPGWCDTPEYLEERLRLKERRGLQLFTNAHMTVGIAGEPKIDTMLRTAKRVYNEREQIVDQTCRGAGSLRNVFDFIQRYTGIGKFIGYEIVCDFRFTLLLCDSEDRLTWANIGPGCRRGLMRLGMAPKLESLHELYEEAKTECPGLIHYDAEVPFELREIEHSLCEFDKYERIRQGQGTSRMKYRGWA